ncbi:UDP-N-acetylmuramoyl-L-alanine--D-glutamate ligase [uncultured Eubacterium sp.]|uniref:UDP-N-acetylmuramoyl-L-alanine--D-glutamate ligase n=1 Tax=uncultured Eubacterium sp. TaxID=165185 RepID=UPI0026723A44|nr:UDP-N-acetylmuramoyl-L-alanine--D-glutamate ligase [uncultured Eubacterium sp.]
MEWNNKIVLVAGSGKSGIGAADLLKKLGASVIIYDGNEKLKKEDILLKLENSENVDVILGELQKCIIEKVDLMVLSPGIAIDAPFVNQVKEAGVPIWGEIELAYVVAKGKLAAITGTNGKTTTTALVGEILSDYFSHVDVVGNIGNPYTSTALDTDENSVTVAEVSSFQLETIHTFKPDVSAVLNITPDHLNRHYTMECYTDVKMSISKNQEKEQPVILNYEDEILRNYAPKVQNKIIWFSSKRKLEQGIFLDGRNIIYKDGNESKVITTTDDTTLVGIHNIENIMAAIGITIHMGVPAEVIREAIRKFKAVPHRIEYVDTIDDVIYYNDSKGTNTDASIKAIQAMCRPTILIAGGYDKKVSFDDWAKEFGDKIKCLVVLGQTANQIADTVRKFGFEKIIFTNSLEEAVEECRKTAVPGDAVLLSPACASWGMFDNYEQRGDLFKELVFNMKK